MKKLILAEKPSVAKNIADATDAVRRNGYFEGNEYIITWAFGHLLQLYDAKDYDPEMKTWRMEKFPYIPEEFHYKLKFIANYQKYIERTRTSNLINLINDKRI